MVLQTWGDVIVASLQQVWISVINFLPLLLGAIIVFLIGWIIAVALGKVVEQIVRALRVDQFLAKLDLEKSLEKAGLRLNSGAFIGGLVKWFLIISFLLAAVNIVQLVQVSNFLTQVILYLPNVIVAALILIIAALIGETVEKIVKATVESMGYRGAFVAVVSRWAIWIFAFVAALEQLGIVTQLIQTIITGLVAGLAIAFGLAFGLGGQNTASQFIEKMRMEMKK